VDDTKNLFRRLLCVGHLHRDRAGMRDGFQKEPSGNPRAHSHLPGLQHDVPPARFLFVLPLRGVGSQRNAMPLAVSDFEDLFHQCQSLVSTDVQLFAHADKVLPRTLSPVESHDAPGLLIHGVFHRQLGILRVRAARAGCLHAQLWPATMDTPVTALR
jgi:hypothetical protein